MNQEDGFKAPCGDPRCPCDGTCAFERVEDTIDGWTKPATQNEVRASRHPQWASEEEIREARDQWEVVDHTQKNEVDVTGMGQWAPCAGTGDPCEVCGQEDDSDWIREDNYRETAEYGQAVQSIVDKWVEKALTPRHPSSERFHQILRELGALHDRKQSDYGRDNDPFANVRGSEEWNMPAWVGAMVRAQDKVRRLQQYNRKGELANESVQDAFMDLAVYAIIAMVLWEQDQT